MFLRLLIQSLVRQRRRKTLAVLAVALGMAVVTAMTAIGLSVGDKMNQELRAYGANLVVTPQEDSLNVQLGGVSLAPAGHQSFLNEGDLARIKTQIFWKHNIVAYAPMLRGTVSVKGSAQPVPILGTYFAKQIALNQNETITTGVLKTHPWWKVSGEWPLDSSDSILVGARLAERLGAKAHDDLLLDSRAYRVAGILTTGSDEEDAIIAPLASVQKMLGRPGAVSTVMVSALTKPEDEFGRRDPKSMGPDMLERWNCSPYANTIAFQISQAIPGSRVEQIRRVTQNEGVLLNRITGLMLLVTITSLLAATMAVSSAMATALYERRREVGLMRTLGANNVTIAGLFACEVSLMALLGGGVGYAAGIMMAAKAGDILFGTSFGIPAVLLPAVLIVAWLVTIGGSIPAIRRALKIQPIQVLRGDTA